MSPHPITGHLRGGLVGVLVGVLAVAAHGSAGAGVPGSTELTLVLLIAAGVGAAAAAGASRACLRPSVAAGLLGAGQLLSHAALSILVGHDHSGTGSIATVSPLPTAWMLLAHIVAAVGCAALIVLAERLYAAVSGALRAILAPPRQTRIAGAPPWSDPGFLPCRCAPLGALGPRAPPLSA
ncbi:hypothetical protein [Nocardia gipuzkoensis]